MKANQSKKKSLKKTTKMFCIFDRFFYQNHILTRYRINVDHFCLPFLVWSPTHAGPMPWHCLGWGACPRFVIWVLGGPNLELFLWAAFPMSVGEGQTAPLGRWVGLQTKIEDRRWLQMVADPSSQSNRATLM